jgi:hypothetical protein
MAINRQQAQSLVDLSIRLFPVNLDKYIFVNNIPFKTNHEINTSPTPSGN